MTFSTLSMPLLLLPLVGGLSARGFGETGISGISKPWTEVPSAPMAGDALLEDGNRLLQGLGLSFSTNWIHDSNVNQANERNLRVESDWILSLAPAVTWETQVRDFTLALNAGANYDYYANLDEYSGLDYRAGGKLGYEGGPLSLDGSVNYGSTQGVDRFAGGLTENRSFVLQLAARYALSTKTVLDASFSAADSSSILQTGASTVSDTSQTVFQLGALWQATPLIRLGPGLRSTLSTTENAGDRTTVGPMLRADYRLSEKVSLDSRIGLDFVEFDGGSSDQFTSAAVGLKYQLDALWGFNFELSRDVEPDTGIGGGFRESMQWRFGVARKILAAQLDLAVGSESSEFSGGRGGPARDDRDYLIFDAGLGMPVFGDRGRARVFVRHQDSSSNAPRDDWSGLQSGLSLSFGF